MVLAGAGFVWNEARKEIVFLCPNFVPGTTSHSLMAQLDTGSFLRYQIRTLPGASEVVIDSAYNLGLYSCVVELDHEQNVIRATLE